MIEFDDSITQKSEEDLPNEEDYGVKGLFGHKKPYID